MTKKEFLNHEWKDGDILYEVAYRDFRGYMIPLRVVRAKITCNPSNCHYAGYNATDSRALGHQGFYFTVSKRFICSQIFFRKEEAVEHFENECRRFKDLLCEPLYEYCVNELKRLDREKYKIWALMRMDVMKKSKDESSDS